MKFSIVTASFNSSRFIKECLKSIDEQLYVEVQHIIIDGDSTDGTKEFLLGQFQLGKRLVVSEKDAGIYDALNKGLKFCENEIIGVLHTDDLYADNFVLRDVLQLFQDGADIVYADLDYVDRFDPTKVFRKWSAGPFLFADLEFGWMPPHPTFFFKKSLLQLIGDFDQYFRISSDYDHMLRFLLDKRCSVSYIPRTIVKMRVGGESNRSLRNIFRKSHEDYLIAKKYFPSPFGTILCKNLRKIKQLRVF
ncbi:MAG: glycosyltransferase [Bacteriovoracaceae bacterium]|nr:glycosyltransferase [Bacteriovoracaceae bacterium]